MVEAQRDPVFAAFFRTEFILVRRQPILAILREGLRRSELPADTDRALARRWRSYFALANKG